MPHGLSFLIHLVLTVIREDALEAGMATHSSILAWRIPWTVHSIAKSWTRLSTSACVIRWREEGLCSY